VSPHGPLAGYRALDLTDHRGALAGRWLADLGVDVVKGEPPGGDRDRDLAWLAGNLGKRSVTLDLGSAGGRTTARRLAETADFVLESFPPGVLARHGLGWPTLAAANPALVLTSITAFGQTGPRAHWKATDLTLMALGGSAFGCGDRRRPPLRIGVPQAWAHAAAEAVVAGASGWTSRPRARSSGPS
jgi:crotonobetainyl-CoA:carnitine CoA-transferase CaiB-like acyl-CoA transferase